MINSRYEVRMEGKNIQEMNYLKGFSIFTIALMHLMQCMSEIPSSIKTLASIGGTGVHVFFLCSGIGLYLSYLNHKSGFTEFISRRVLKIYVPYIAVILISFFIPWLYKGSDRFAALLSHIFLFKMFIPKYEESFGAQFWFVSTIIQLYLLFIPMCHLKEKIKNRMVFVGLFFGMSIFWWILCYVIGVSNERVWNGFCLQYIWEFALGFVIAEIFNNGRKITVCNRLLLVLTIAGISLQAGMAFISDSLKLFNDIPALIGYTSLALLLMNIPFIKQIGIHLSGFSYEFFLVHMLIFSTMFHLAKPQGIIRQTAVGFIAMIIALGVAYLYKRLISKVSKYLRSS